jgi:hypothetical protein
VITKEKIMFKKGDKVVCINVEEIGCSVPNNVTLNKTYTVDEDQDGDTNVYVIGDNGCRQGLFPKRFTLAEPVKTVLDLTKPVETSTGELVTIVLTDARGEFPLRGYIGNAQELTSWKLDGKYFSHDSNWRDLRNAPPKPREREVYINVYENGDGKIFSTSGHESRAVADSNATKHRLGCVKVKLVEGQYDE